ncbi:hypothetical protein OG765_12500 [Streptomyces sp. NBC_00555]|uniref:hypothetical protein n=1 Tax=unclassified Streptomyces TaxID=2593676 RepID=UPI00214B1DC7|nr:MULTISPECIES: hypothetical protein [unclassified Streptomyces]MCX5011802.1 hypothetical protein [Streptomyces sp. NBC_00555]UUU40070.1 hypothetical protein JIW86_15405 [Streptomyces sp. NBC_00162]
MTTFVNYLAVLVLAAVLLGPSLYGARGDRRIDRQLRAAATRRVWLPRQRAGGLPPTPRRRGIRFAAWRRGRMAH